MPEELTVEQVIDRVKRRKLTYLKKQSLRDLADVVADLEERGIAGAVVECGAALGGSAIVMAAAKSQERPMWVYDMFGTIPPPSDKDGEKVQERYDKIARGESHGIRGDVYYGYREDLLGEVRKRFRRFGLPPRRNAITLVKGDFRDTLDVDYPVAVAHLDGDWYESTMVCLQRIWPKVVPGGRIVVDDYDHWEGCRRAVDEFFADRTDYVQETRNKVHFVRKSE